MTKIIINEIEDGYLMEDCSGSRFWYCRSLGSVLNQLQEIFGVHHARAREAPGEDVKTDTAPAPDQSEERGADHRTWHDPSPNAFLAGLFARQAEMFRQVEQQYARSMGGSHPELARLSRSIAVQYEVAAEVCRGADALVDGFNHDEESPECPHADIRWQPVSRVAEPLVCADCGKRFDLAEAICLARGAAAKQRSQKITP